VPDLERRALPAPAQVSPNALPPDKPIEEEVPTDDSARPLRPVTVVPVVNGAELRRPVVAEHAAVPARRGQVPTEPGAAEPAYRPTTHPTHGPVQITASASTHPPQVQAHHRINPVDAEPATRRVEPAVAYPTGIVVQNEPGMYRPDRPLRIEEYIRFSEPQVDANGEETWTPLYHAKAKVR